MQCGHPMKCLRYNNGVECVGKYFEKYLQYNGISWKIFTPYTPQKNYIAKIELEFGRNGTFNLGKRSIN